MHAYELQNTKTMIDQIVSASHQNAEIPVRMEEELSAVSDKMEMDTFCGEVEILWLIFLFFKVKRSEIMRKLGLESKQVIRVHSQDEIEWNFDDIFSEQR